MECLFVFFTVVALLIATMGAMIARESGTSRRRSYQRIALRFTARYDNGGLFRRPAVLIQHGETRAVLREVAAQGPYQGHCTQVRIDFVDRNLEVDIFPRANEGEVPAQSRMVAISTDKSSFDEVVVVRAGPRSEIKSLFSDGVCWQLNRLLVLGDEPQFYVKFRRGQLFVQKPILLREFELLEEFVSASLDLYDQLMLTRAEGIEFVESEAIDTLSDVMCSICGHDITTDMVYCKRCKTPHHGECWDYTGGCSVFGCQESQCLRPQPGKSTASDN
jgi:hypothetical protein